MSKQQKLIIISLVVIILIPIVVSASQSSCNCNEVIQDGDKAKALKFKLIAMSAILIASVLGVSLPILGNKIPTLNPQNDVFFMIKAFAAGVILATGFVHILPDAFDSLTSPCLEQNPWGKFPFAGFVAMLSAIGTMMIDTFATSYYQNAHFKNNVALPSVTKQDHSTDIQIDDHSEDAHLHVHTHGHAHGSAFLNFDDGFSSSHLIRHRIISQVLELGIVVHSVIIGVSLGASQSPNMVKFLITALTFHQFFEGMGLGGCISQAKFKSKAIIIMVLFFSLTTTTGIGIGMGISSIYNENSPTALIIEGLFNSASAGILIYMALVDLIAADFMNPRMQSNLRLLLAANLSLLLGVGCMSLLAKWA